MINTIKHLLGRCKRFAKTWLILAVRDFVAVFFFRFSRSICYYILSTENTSWMKTIILQFKVITPREVVEFQTLFFQPSRTRIK